MDGKLRKLALKAHRLSKKGLRGKAAGAALKVSTHEANALASIGTALVQMEAARLTGNELLLLRTIARRARWNLDRGVIRSVESRNVEFAAHKYQGWVAATCRKRLFTERWDDSGPGHVRGLGFVRLAGNGYVWLTQAGWALVLALEAAEREAA